MKQLVQSSKFKVQSSKFARGSQAERAPRTTHHAPRTTHHVSRFTHHASLLTLLAALTATAAIPAPEKLLPNDTLIMVTAPDFAKLKDTLKKSPQNQFWDDPAMKPFKDKFMAKWNEELIKPLERDLDVRLDDYTSLPQGQFTIALTQNGWDGQPGHAPGLLLLVDTKDKSDQLKKNLAELRKKCADAGKAVKTEKIRDLDFFILSISTNDMPRTLRKLFPETPPSQPPAEGEAPKPAEKDELVVGQFESLLIVGNSTKAVERIVARCTGGSVPTLSDVPSYQANHLAMFREAPVYGWINAKAFVDILVHQASAEKADSETPNPFASMKPEKIVAALGLSALKTIAFNFQDSTEGALLQLFLSVPESGRQGLFKIIAPEAKESSPPPFIPADAVRFQRWRLDGQKTWAALEKTLSDLSPEAIGTLNLILNTANAAAKEKDAGFDVKKNLIGNLGDDMISYEKAPRADAPASAQTPPSLFLLGSPNPEQFAAALKSILIFLNQQGGAPKEREFLGRKIFSVPAPSLPSFPMTGSGPAQGPRTLHYAASSGYVAMSSDAAMLEEYLRSSDSHAKALRETSGLLEAAQKVGGTGTGLFGYNNRVETTRLAFETMKKHPGPDASAAATGFSPLPGANAAAGTFKAIQQWADFSLFPPFDKVSKYFYFSVYAGSANVDGLTFKVFVPVPPALRK
jgi:hypothetical protein